MAFLDRELNLAQDFLDWAQIRDQGQGYVPIADLSPFPESVVVGFDTSELIFGIPEGEAEIADRRVWKQHFAVNPVFVQGFDPLGRVVGLWWHLGPPPRTEATVRHERWTVGHRAP